MQRYVPSENVSETIKEALQQGCRLDGRQVDELLPIELRTDAVLQAAGSSELRMGSVHVLAAVKAELGVPLEHRPDEGGVSIDVHVTPSATATMDAAALEQESAAAASLLNRLLLARDPSDCGLDLKSLCVIRGHCCWWLRVDCVVLAPGGGLLDALAAAVYVALRTTKVPMASVDKDIEDPSAEHVSLDPDASASVTVDVTKMPVVVAVSQVGSRVLVGATREEEAAASAILYASVNHLGQVCGMSKAGGAMMDAQVMQHMIMLAQQHGKRLVTALQQYNL